jgi:sporulation protein YlmC with PRC-barrel domain
MEPYQSKWVGESSHSFHIGESSNLVPLSEADIDLDGMPDITDWDVIGSDGEKIGEVQDLIVDPKSKKARYIDVLAEEELGSDERRRRLLIPIGAASVSKEEKEVKLSGISHEQLEKCPPFGGCPITQDFAEKVHVNFGKDEIDSGVGLPHPGSDYNYEDFYNHALYDSDRFNKGK